MKATEAKVLEGLRKSTLAYLSEKEYAEIIDAVEKQGLLGLTGAASRVVKSAVIKHGSHDQKTHGRGGKGGGGGGGSSASSGSSSEKDKQGDQLADDFLDKTNGVSGEIDDASDPSRQSAKQYDASTRAAEKIEAARVDFSAAKELTGRKKLNKLQSGIKKYESSMEELITAGEDNIAQGLSEALDAELANTLGLESYMGI
jgi:hypothetical protein